MALETDKNNRSFITQNDKPAVGSVAGRNSKFDIWLPAGVAYKVIVETEGDQKVVASGTSSVREGKFNLQVRTRITDSSNEPKDTAEAL